MVSAGLTRDQALMLKKSDIEMKVHKRALDRSAGKFKEYIKNTPSVQL